MPIQICTTNEKSAKKTQFTSAQKQEIAALWKRSLFWAHTADNRAYAYLKNKHDAIMLVSLNPKNFLSTTNVLWEISLHPYRDSIVHREGMFFPFTCTKAFDQTGPEYASRHNCKPMDKRARSHREQPPQIYCAQKNSFQTY